MTTWGAWLGLAASVVVVLGAAFSVVRALFRLIETLRALTAETRRNTQATTLLFRAYTNLAERLERLEVAQDQRPTRW